MPLGVQKQQQKVSTQHGAIAIFGHKYYDNVKLDGLRENLQSKYLLMVKFNFKKDWTTFWKTRKKESVCVVPTPHFPMQCFACEEHWALTRH